MSAEGNAEGGRRESGECAKGIQGRAGRNQRVDLELEGDSSSDG